MVWFQKFISLLEKTKKTYGLCLKPMESFSLLITYTITITFLLFFQEFIRKTREDKEKIRTSFEENGATNPSVDALPQSVRSGGRCCGIQRTSSRSTTSKYLFIETCFNNKKIFINEFFSNHWCTVAVTPSADLFSLILWRGSLRLKRNSIGVSFS